MLSLGAILFFSITGFTLNHPDWFFQERTLRFEGVLAPSLLNPGYAAPIDKLGIAEFLRAEHGLRGRVGEFLIFEDQSELTFQGPGYAATARIQHSDGTYNLDVITNDLISVLNDLHKGRNTGPWWSIFIDVSAIVSAIVALSGLMLIFYLKLNKPLRLWIAFGGFAMLLLLIWSVLA